jgi:hypothetical protein
MNFDSVTFKEKSRLRMVLSTLREMLKDRGYNVDEIERWPDASEIEKSCDYVKISMLISVSNFQFFFLKKTKRLFCSIQRKSEAF